MQRRGGRRAGAPPAHLAEVVGDDHRVAEQLHDDGRERQPLGAARAQDLDDLGRAAEEGAHEHCVAEHDGGRLGQAPARGGGRGGAGARSGRGGRGRARGERRGCDGGGGGGGRRRGRAAAARRAGARRRGAAATARGRRRRRCCCCYCYRRRQGCRCCYAAAAAAAAALQLLARPVALLPRAGPHRAPRRVRRGRRRALPPKGAAHGRRAGAAAARAARGRGTRRLHRPRIAAGRRGCAARVGGARACARSIARAAGSRRPCRASGAVTRGRASPRTRARPGGAGVRALLVGLPTGPGLTHAAPPRPRSEARDPPPAPGCFERRAGGGEGARGRGGRAGSVAGGCGACYMRALSSQGAQLPEPRNPSAATLALQVT